MGIHVLCTCIIFISLLQAIKKKDVTEMKRLLELMSQEEINEYDASGLTALHYAVENNCLGAMELFFYKRAGFVSNKLILSKSHDGNILKIFQSKQGIQIAITKHLCTEQQNLKKDQLK